MVTQLCLLLLIITLSSVEGVANAQDSTFGNWDGPFVTPVVGRHAIVLRTGKVLIWASGSSGTLWDPTEADDVFSAAVLAAYENRHKYTPGTNFRAWMFRILLNKCFVANRETGRRMEPLEMVENSIEAAAEAPEHWDALADPIKILDACGDEVYRAFGKLSMAQRACIMLKGVEHFTYREISDTLEIPVGTVMTHLARGRAKLRKLLADYAMNLGIIPAAAEG